MPVDKPGAFRCRYASGRTILPFESFGAAQPEVGPAVTAPEMLLFDQYAEDRSKQSGNMKTLYSRYLALVCVLVLSLDAAAQLPCVGAGGVIVPVGNWAAATVPATMTGSVTTTTTIGSTTATVSSAAGLAIGNSVSGANIPGGTTILGIAGTTLTLSNPATASGVNVLHSYTVPGWVSNAPPANIVSPGNLPTTTAACSICPSLFSATITANNFVSYYMCAGNVYTISLCSSAAFWNSTLSITTSAFASAAGQGFVLSDDDGCGPANGHATLTFIPTTTGSFRIRVFSNNAGNPCTLNAALVGTIQITCSPAPPPPANDGPCGALPLTVGSTCSMTATTTSWASNTNPPGAPSCGSYAGFDTWYTAMVPASGALAVQTNQVGATNLAMAIYTATACNASVAGWTQQYCNVDIAAGVLQPFIAFNNIALAGQTVYIRIWPQSGASAGGTFEICAYEPTPPANDNPCAAVVVPVTAGCLPVSATTQDATPTAGVPVPSCGIAGVYNDVWFTVQVPVAPPGAGVIINTSSLTLNDAAMTAYTSATCAGPFTEVGCSDPAGATMPSLQVNQNGGTIVGGTVLFVRLWNKTAVFGNVSICATPTVPPSNNEPCGAAPLNLEYGCLYSGFTNTNASTTPTTLAGQHLNVPNPSCGGVPTNDVWFSITAPNPLVAGQNLVIDTDDGSLANAAMAVYRVVSGNCTGTLTLAQIACQTSGSTNNANMPVISIVQTTLVPGETLYIRVWREGGTDGTFSICARRTDTPPGNCSYTLRMNDTAGDGWNGSYVTVCVGALCTNYTIIGAGGFITFPANFGQLVTVTYVPVGGFQNQISYQITTPNGGILFNSGTSPTAGLVFAFTVNGSCNVPPAPQEDCVGALQVCSSSAVASNPQNTGAVADLGIANRGCLVTNEHMGVWFTFQVSQPGQLGFTVNPFTYGSSDYDYGLWGPYPSVSCPPVGLPLRCSWADGPSLTGLNWVATDASENAFGDSWTQYINTSSGDWYIMFVDNWYYTGLGFDLTFQGAPGCGVGANPPCSSVSCSLPVRFLQFTGQARGAVVDLAWTTATEVNSSHFIVERSADGSNYLPIGRIGAAGASALPINYAFVDPAPVTGMNYYRLQQVDLDGKAVWSNTVGVLFRATRVPIQVFPNPANELLNVLVDVPLEHGSSWRFMDASGRTISTGTAQAQGNDERSILLNTNALEPGSYMVELLGPRGVFLGNARFVKQ